MYILFGQSIDNGLRFIGPSSSEKEIERVKHEIDFNEDYEDLAIMFTWSIIELIDLQTMNNGHYFHRGSHDLLTQNL